MIEIIPGILEKNFDVHRFDVGYIKNTDSKLVRLRGDDLKKYLR